MDDLQSSEEATFVVEEVSQIIKEVSPLTFVLIIVSSSCVVGNDYFWMVLLLSRFETGHFYHVRQYYKYCVMFLSCSPSRTFWVAATTSTIASTSGPPQWWSSVSTNSLNWANHTST